jgi:hypothetical protein
MMHGLIVEDASFGANPSTKDLARHLYTRIGCGKVVIVANNPPILLSALRKQWLKLARKLQKERASTLNGTLIYEFSQTAAQMQALRFTIKWPQDECASDVYIVTIEQLLKWAPECRTLYITCPVSREQLHMITVWMTMGSLVVLCELK